MERKWYSIRWHFLLLALVATVDVSMLAYLRFFFSPGWPSDSLAHALNARMIIDNITPGFSQIGFWPPILHILLVPASLSKILFRSDLMGFVSLFPVLYIASWLLFNIVSRLTKSTGLAWLATILLLLNPYVAYFSVASMTEIVFLAAFLGFMNSWLRWIQGASDSWLLLSAFLVSVMFLSRYEGILIIPISILLFYLSARHRNVPLRQTIALLVLCAMLSSLGLFWVFLYGFYYGGDPLAFLSIGVRSSSGVIASPSDDIYIVDRLVIAWKTGVFAADHLLGRSFWFLGCATATCAMFAIRGNRVMWLVLALSAIPFISIIALIAANRAFVIVPELYLYKQFPWPSDLPSETFVNTRYFLPAILLPIFGSVLFMGSMIQGMGSRIAKVALSLILLLVAGWHLYSVVLVDSFRVIRHDNSNVRAQWLIDATSPALFDRFYDGGFVLVPRYYSEVAITRSNIPINAYIHEGTYLFFRQAMREPWLFARMVAVPLNGKGPDVYQLQALTKTTVFQQYYVEVFHDNDFAIYRLDERAVRTVAATLGYDISRIPSLVSTTVPWDPAKIYEQLKASKR